MSVSTSIQVNDGATPALAAVLAEHVPERLAERTGPAFLALVQGHLAGNGTNKEGGSSTNFWGRAAQATSWAATAGGVTVSVRQAGVRQRWLGGTIAPRNAQALAVPISPLSYGRVPRDFPGLFVLATKKGAYLVQAGEAPSVKVQKRRGGGRANRQARAGLVFLFKLADRVFQNADPGVMPGRPEFFDAACGALTGDKS